MAFLQAEIVNTVSVLAGPLLEPDYERRIPALSKSTVLKRAFSLQVPSLANRSFRRWPAELFILPSLNESFGNAAAEVVAAGLPVCY